MQKQSSELDSNMKSQKIEDLQSQISKLEQSVGDEVPGLIQENMEQKEKIREERKKADKAGLEVRLRSFSCNLLVRHCMLISHE